MENGDMAYDFLDNHLGIAGFSRRTNYTEYFFHRLTLSKRLQATGNHGVAFHKPYGALSKKRELFT
jgi:hypothetical protein